MPDAFTPADTRFMRRALTLARRGRTHPNPHVGAVVVQSGVIVGEGFHPRQGQPHAEAFAFVQAGEAARGGTLYVTLEPCSHRDNGRVPCVDRCRDAGVSEVIVAMVDPDTRVSGRGIAELRALGISVRVGLLERESRALNQPYIKQRTTGLPYITHKAAMTLDGKIATHTGDSRWVTGDAARAWVHRLRNRVDAVVVGVGTVLRDNPSLTTRLPRGNGYDPVRVIIDSVLRTPPDAKVAAPGTIFLITDQSAPDAVRVLEARGAEVVILPADAQGRADVAHAARFLADRGLYDVLLESGGILAASFWQAGLVDKAAFFVAPKVAGGRDAPTPIDGGGLCGTMANAVSWSMLRARKIGADILLEGEVKVY